MHASGLGSGSKSKPGGAPSNWWIGLVVWGLIGLVVKWRGLLVVWWFGWRGFPCTVYKTPGNGSASRVSQYKTDPI